MGHSITDFRGQAFGTNDSKLDVWLKLLSRQIAAEELLPVWLSELGNHWATVGDWGVGCIDAQLDRYLIDQDRIDTIGSLAETTLRFLENQGPVLTCDFLNELVSAGATPVFPRDLDTEMFIRVGQAFLRLIRLQSSMNSTTEPMQWV